MKEFITKVFDYDSDAMRFISLLCNITLLNVIWFICCIPIVTIGAATMAQYYATNKMIEDDRHVIRNFKEGFKLHWKRSTIIWLIFACFLVLFYLDYSVFTTSDIPGKAALLGVSFLASLTLIMVVLWIYPVMLYFKGSFLDIIFNSFMFAFIYTPYTILAGAFYVLTLYLCAQYPLVTGMVFAFGQGLIVFFILLLFRRAFKKYQK